MSTLRSLEEIRIRYILFAMEQHGWNQTNTASAIKCSTRHIRYVLQRARDLGIPFEVRGDPGYEIVSNEERLMFLDNPEGKSCQTQ